jgi:hypothetical protein
MTGYHECTYADYLTALTGGDVDLSVNAWSRHGLQRRDRMMITAD